MNAVQRLVVVGLVGLFVLASRGSGAGTNPEEYCYPPGSNHQTGLLHVAAKDVQEEPEVNFPLMPLPVTLERAAARALEHFRGRFPEAAVPQVEGIELRRFPEEFGRNRFFYLIRLKPEKSVNRSQFREWLLTKEYLVIVMAAGDGQTAWSQACAVVTGPEAGEVTTRPDKVLEK